MARKSAFSLDWTLVRDYGLTVVIAVAAALLVRGYVLEAYRIPTSTMRPSLEPGDTLFVSKLPYAWKRKATPSLGEVVVYAPVSDQARRDSIKRVVALSGDTVQWKGGKLRVNGEDLDPPGYAAGTCGEEKALGSKPWNICWSHPPLEDTEAFQIPADSVLLAGDLRGRPIENRLQPPWEVVPKDRIKGRAWAVWISIKPGSQDAPEPLSRRIRWERLLKRI